MTAPPDDTTTDTSAIIATLRTERDAALAREAALAKELAARAAELAERNTEYSERIEQQAGTVGDAEALTVENQELRAAQAAGLEVLQAMIATPGDTQPVFDLIARQAADLCEVPIAAVAVFDGVMVRLVSQSGFDAAYAEVFAKQFPRPPSPDFAMGRAIVNRRVEQIEDTSADTRRDFAPPPGPGSALAVPLLRNGAPLGVIAVGRRVAGPYSKNQIALLQTFAEQAVIAITSAETYRALQTRTSDLQETLEYQTATSDVLKVISQSTFDLQPVLDTLVETATRLCDAEQAAMARREGDLATFVANAGFPPEYAAYQQGRGNFPLDPNSPSVGQRAVCGGRPVHIYDVTAVPGYPDVPIRLGRHRTVLGVPLLREGEAVGVIVLARQRVEPFTDRQIELVSTFADQAVIAIENTRLLTEQREALEQQTATAEVLQVINSSPGNLGPVFEAILEKAHALCGAAAGALVLVEGDQHRALAVHGEPEFAEYWMQQGWVHAIPPAPLMRGEPIHIADAAAEEGSLTSEQSKRLVELSGARSLLIVPLYKDNVLLGTITAFRKEVRPFTDKQIALLQNFAAQAVIAMENARLLTEQREALEQQTATAEVLQVINASPGNLAPVFDAMLEKAMRLCGAAFGSLYTYDGERFHYGAQRGVPEEYAEFRAKYPPIPHPEGGLARALRTRRSFQVVDVRAGEAYRAGNPNTRAMVELGGVRTILVVPLCKEEAVLGTISVYRQEVRAFTDEQIALVENFAAQAVIAIENARLITEQREALEQQTATAEVLQVINASPGNLAPVFDAILEKAHRLCGATHGSLQLFDGEKFRAVATYGISEVWAERTRDGLPAVNNPVTEPLLDGARLVHIADMVDINHPLARVAAEATGVRTALFVPLRKDNSLIGVISALRREVRPFTEKEIALLENFAAQAVIAIENARLIIEQQDALEQQTATAEVLQVINASPGNLVPVFDAMLDRALRLCSGAYGSLLTFDGEKFLSVATRGDTQFSDWARQRGPFEPPSEGPLHRSLKGEDIVEITDLLEHSEIHEDPVIHRMVELGGYRSLLNVALRKENAFFGVIAIYRKEKRPFDHKEIALLQNFAAQAVIAIENARLITEQREALEQQTATAEVLQVINSSPGNLAPVFDAMLEKAMRLCGAAIGGIYRYNGQGFDTVALLGVTPAFQEYNDKYPMVEVRPGSLPARMIETRGPVQNPDVLASERAWSPYARALAELGGIRAVLDVPLLKEGALLGFIAIYREEAGAFSDKQIALLEDFAAQAVIAMENARLITETQEALQQQTATAEVLQVINSSPGDLGPVFDAMLDRAMALCEADYGHVYAFEGGQFTPAAIKGDPGFISYRTQRGPIRPQGDGTSALERLIAGESVVWAADVHEEQAYRTNARFRELADTAGIRSMATIALRKENSLRGAIIVYRRQVRPFSQKQIALLQNFAAQAVIAMENARLINEQREALEQQTATAEVLQVINGNPGDLAPVFDAMLEKATRLCDAAAGTFWVSDGEQWQAVAIRGMPEHFVTSAREYRPSPNSPVGRLAGGEELVHLPDLSAEEVYKYGDRLVRAAVDTNGIRTLLSVPLRNERRILGVFSLYRREVHPFTDTQIALAQNFAAQAVIAMENARLLTEQREALEQQTATAEVLQVINASPGNLAPVFDAILEKAHSLCGVALGDLELYEDGKCRAVAMRGVSGPLAELLRQPFTPPPNSPFAGLLAGEPVVQIVDLFELAQQRPDFRRAQAGAQYGLRTALFVPLRKDDALLGCITAYRQEVRPFSEKEVALLQNFAAQAVIAMENTRLITEISEALEQQTATAEVLGVINSSPGDLRPVFDAILEKAHALCGAATGSLQLYDGEFFRAVATRGLPDEFANILRQPHRSGLRDALLRDAPFVQITDIADPVLTGGDKTLAVGHEIAGVRTYLRVPLRKDDALLGLIIAGRREVRPFSQKEISLLQSFAAQAVIAMDNARLLDEIRQRQAELRTTFDNMGDGVAMFDTDLRLTAWNRNFQRIIDLPDTLLETRLRYADYLRLLAERGEFGTTDIEAELSLRIEDTDKELRLERVRPDGRVIEVRRNAVPGGGFVLIYSDITERKRSEEEIRAARDAAETALRELRTAQANLIQAEKMASLGQLTAGIAHEIKNPLNFVNNFSALSTELIDELRDVLAAEPLGETARTEVDDLTALLKGNLEKVVQHGQRADGIVRSMLDHSRGSSGERRMVDLNALIDEALNLAYHGARAQDQSFNITLERDFGEGISPIEVNPQDITRVFLNLFTNGFYAATRRARDGGDAGFVPTLKVTTSDAGEMVEIRVRDNGTGIPADIRDKLFQPFFTTKPTGEGTGLGLSITYDIVTQQHSGNITVDSNDGEYSEFIIRLPRNP